MKKEITVESGYGYRIYFYNGLYFVDLFFRNKCDGYETLAGARECVYYAGLRETKD